MSYEGYEQHICENGHRFDIYNDESPKCYHCGAASVWYNSVDDTNCAQEGYIPSEFFRHFEHGKIAVPFATEDWQTYTTGDHTYYCKTHKRIELPKYVVCEYDFSVCNGTGNAVAQNPMNNPCE